MPFPEGIPEDFHAQFAAWVRLEPRCRSNDWARGLQARTADPLWMLARQWQTGEFQGEDAGSPIEIRLAHSTQSLDRLRLGESKTAFNIPNAPLEAIIEQERFELNWRARVQIGQQFERFARTEPGVDAEALITAYRTDYPLELSAVDIARLKAEIAQIEQQLQTNDLTDAQRQALETQAQAKRDKLTTLSESWVETDHATRRFLNLMASRVIDGKKLLEAIENGPLVPPPGLTANQLEQVLKKFNEWRTKLRLQPIGSKSDAWRNQQLDYRFELNPPEDPATDKTNLKVPDYRNGSLDWYAFLMKSYVDDDDKWTQEPPIKTHPTRVSVGGTSPRWWAFEDAATDFGKLDVAKPDLAKLLLMEFVLIYGDDWFSVPVPVCLAELLDAGSVQEEWKVYPKLVRIDGLKVRNVFGEETLVRPARQEVIERIKEDPSADPGNPLLRWEMFTLAPGNAPQEPALADVLFIPPVAGFREESSPIEEVRFLRDEGANMVWGVEHLIPNGLGKPVDGFNAQRERIEREQEAEIARLETLLSQIEQQLEAGDLTDQEREELEADTQGLQDQLVTLREGPRPTSGGAPRYRLATTVPENWIPFVPTNATPFFGLTYESICLRRAQMLRNTDAEDPELIPAMSRILDLSEDPLLWLEEATIPRSGLRTQLTAQRVRWVDGKTYVWLGRKVTTGRGEGSSGLRFDFLRTN
jgi:hypothetical protein